MSDKDYICPGCDKRIEGGQVSKALGKRYHKECFKCNGCGAEITSSFFVKNDKPYCKNCFNEKFGCKCEVCGEFISKHILKYNDKAYHYTCLQCDACKKYFKDEEGVSVKSSKDGPRFMHNDCRNRSKANVTRGNNDKVKEIKGSVDAEEPYQGELGEFEDFCLKKHNYYRRMHHAKDLGWSEECAKHARKWVKHLKEIDMLAHDQASGMGENCGYFSSSNAQNKADKEWANNVCDMWYKEIEKYDFNKNDYQPQTGHFTQMVWKGTEKVGCALAKHGNKVYVVANYYPPGNFMGRYAENVARN